MNTLDSPYINPQEVSPWATIMRYGLIGGLISIAYALVMFMVSDGDIQLMSMLGWLSLVITIVVIVLAIRAHRTQDLGGFISFGRAFMVAFFTILVMSLIGALFNYVYTNFIEPDYYANMMEQIGEMYEEMGLGEEQIEQSLSMMKTMQNPLITFGTSILGGAVISLIVAAITAKKAPTGV